MASTTKIIAKAVREEIHRKGLKQKDLADRLGFSQKHVSQMLLGHVSISLDYLPFILDFAGLELRIVNKKESP